jgi:SIR2-like domain
MGTDDRPRDENLENLVNNWEDYQGRIILFLGAGASAPARGGVSGSDPFPTAWGLRNELWKRFMLPAGERDRFDPTSLGMLTLEHASALIESRRGRKPLIEFIDRMYSANRPLWSHLVLPLLKPRAVFTTNYDPLIEKGWNACQTLGYAKDPLTPIFAAGQRLGRTTVPLFKPHGSVGHAEDAVGSGGLVITTFDYFEMVEAQRKLLTDWLGQFQATCAIFIGYGLADMDIASYLYELRKKDRGLNWYAVFPRVDDDVKRMYHEKFKIQTIARTMHDFLVDLDAAVDFLPPALKATEIPELQKHHIQ